MLDCLTRLGFKTIDEAERITLAEYVIYGEAAEINEVNHYEELALQAWFNQTVQATTGGKHPKPKYKRFSKFFNSDKQITKIRQRYEPWLANRANTGLPQGVPEDPVARLREFKRLKAAGKIVPWSKRNGGRS